MQKPLAAFAISLVLSIGFTQLSLAVTLSEPNSFFRLSSMLFGLVTLAVFFGVFYFLADKYKMRALKSTVLALLLGVIFGPALIYLIEIEMSSPSLSLFGIFLLYSLSLSSFPGIFNFFLPSIIALLFVELRQSRSANGQQPIQ
jgi:cellobiose-specific phosphotransferase system component IIC